MIIIIEPGAEWTKSEVDGVVGYISTEYIDSGYSVGNLGKLLSEGGGFCAVPVPTCAGAYLNSNSTNDLLARKFAVYGGETSSQFPASTSKTMTMLCTLNIVSNLQEIITLTSSDVSFSGSGSTYFAGDKLTIEDALRIMMMESSNKLAEALSRFVGNKLLNISNTRN